MDDDCDCRRVLDELQRYLDGECPETLERTVRAHLHDCPPCLDRAGFERSLRAIVARRCRDAAPAGMVERVIARLRIEASGL
ncbi:MAG TPA: mycothiol system anti-sigma-R factor [Egibacteraceae bacterium]|nr:mycothiol system anti-sigma-R factor [Actinomycetota bacterium]HWB72569.1 mycothiol system anti-sigma-R factor [Egibacteraceae bacterium]